MDEHMRFSHYGQTSRTPSPVNRMMTAFSADFREGIDVNLGVGYVNQETMPRQEIRDALEYVLEHHATYRNALNYGSAQGSPRLIAAIKEFYRQGGLGEIDDAALERSDVLIGASGATSILMGLAQAFEPGIVITADPTYYIYCNLLERMGFEIVAVPEDDCGMSTLRLHDLVAALGERRSEIRFVYVSTVGNPTSTLLGNSRRADIVAFAHKISHDMGIRVPVIFDTAYEALVHDQWIERPVSGLSFDREGLVYEVGSFSKILAPALRTGYLLGPHTELFDILLQNVSDMGFSAPLVIQEMAAFLIERDGLRQLQAVHNEYARRATIIRDWLHRTFHDHLENLTGGSAGFYFYLTLTGIPTGEGSDFFRFLTRTTGDERVDGPPHARKPRVVYIPGEYCVSPRGDLATTGRRQLRISYGYESLQAIEKGLELMSEATTYALSKAET